LESTNRKLAEANHAKEKLFSVIAHDLRGPVGNLKASLDMLGSGTLETGEFEALVSDLAADVDKSHVCLENLLCWSASQLGGITVKVDEVNLRDAVEEVTHLSGFAMSRKHLQFSNSVPETAKVFVDVAHFQAILRNLISNAVKFTPAGGKISVDAVKSGNAWKLCIADSGLGMPPEKVEWLFHHQQRSSTPGTDSEKGFGLGLDICREFVSLNHGTISAESTPGLGTKIFVTLPATPDTGGSTSPA
jgi:signal transduction histidine kinase